MGSGRCLRGILIAAVALAAVSLFPSHASAQYDVSGPVILQDFDSNYLATENKMPDIFESGYGSVYLPPPGYSTTTNSVGYDVYNRFDLGTAQQPTTYGTQAEFESVVQGIHSFGGKVYSDLLWNVAGSMNANTSGFAASGGYPGLAVTLQDTNPNVPGYNTLGYEANGTSAGASYQDPPPSPGYAGGPTYYYNGDFHDPNEPSNGDDGQVAGLDDIAQETNFHMIRQPTTAGNPLNIPEGTTPWNGYLANVPTASNAQYYPDLSETPKVVTNNGQTFTIYPYNPSDPMAGTAVAENATGYLMRYTQWMLQDMGVDGFRVDAALNMPTWVLNYLDTAVYDESPHTLLNGSQQQVYSFSEVYSSNTSLVNQYVNLSDTNPSSSTVQGNRDALDFPLYFAMSANLSAFNGAFGASGGNNWNNVVQSSLDYSDDGLLNGSEGVKFVSDQDGGIPAPGLVQVAYAYTLMLPGNAIVYYNGQTINNESGSGSSGYFPEGGANDPKDSEMGALGGTYDTNNQNSAYSNLNITNLVDLRNRYGRGNYRQDWIEQNLLAYERTGSCVVMLSNSTTAGYETRSFDVTFAPGTWLEEETGNATSSYADPNGDIPQFLQVQAGGSISGGGYVNARFLNNATYALGGGSTYATNDGFLIYALPTPTGNLTLAGNSSTMASQTGAGTTPGGWEPNANYSNGTERNVPVQVVTGASFTLTLNTVEANLQVSPTQVYHDQDADGNNAQFTIDGGAVTVAPNGITSTTPGTNGETTTPGDVSYGYQNFGYSSPGYSNANGNGTYSQTIDTANLSIGYHYIEVIAFRYNEDKTAPPVYSDWYDTIYVDRGTPTSSIQSFQPFSSAPTTYENRQLDIQSDGTTTSEYAFLNLPVGITNAQILNMISTGNDTINGVNYSGGSAGQIDQNLFAYGFNGLQNGNNVATVVSYRPDGNYSIQRFTADEVSDLGHSTLNGLGLGDINEDGAINSTDVTDFYQDVNSEGQKFNPAADMNGDGLNDPNDWLLFDQELIQNNQLSSSSPYYVSSNTISSFNGVTGSILVPVAAGTNYNLQVPVSSVTLGAVTMGAGSTLTVTGTNTNAPYTLTLGGVSVSGSATFVPTTNGTASATLNLGGLNDGGTPASLVFTGTGVTNLTAAGSLVAATTITINSGSNLAVKAASALGTSGVSVINNGTFTIAANQTIGNLSGTGALIVGNGSTSAALTFATNSSAEVVSSLTINPNASINLTNNYMIVDYGTGPDPIATIRQYLATGYNHGAWSGVGGIDTSLDGSTYAIGYADGADGVVSGLPSGEILIQYALYGDANLDGRVNGEDFAIMAANFNKYAPNWDQGDFNYDNSVNGSDFVLLASNFNKYASQADNFSSTAIQDLAALDAFAAANGFSLSVPEPASLAFLIVGTIGAFSRRRRTGDKHLRGNPLRTGAFL